VLLSQFNIPISGGIPEFITVGPDGNMWFTETVAVSQQQFYGPVGPGYVGRVALNGNFTMFAIPGTTNTLKGITAGPDGNIWFVEQYASVNKIGRLTTSGQLTEFAIPTANSLPSTFRPGPDGNLWFTEYGANQIARITPAGVITEVPIPTPNSGPLDIVTGPDGNLWFTEGNANQIGRFSLIPTVGPITAPVAPVAVNTAVNVSAPFTDAIPGITDTAARAR
jgi:virginiamycin B lyase